MTMALKHNDGRPNFEGTPCTQIDPELFFPDNDTIDMAAQLACAMCPIRPSCLQYAIDTGMDGYWGGTTKHEREALVRKYDRVKCPGCGSTDVLEDEHTGVCAACALSWPT